MSQSGAALPVLRDANRAGVIGSGDPRYVTSPGGFVIGWLLAFFGVAIVATMTGVTDRLGAPAPMPT